MDFSWAVEQLKYNQAVARRIAEIKNRPEMIWLLYKVAWLVNPVHDHRPLVKPLE